MFAVGAMAVTAVIAVNAGDWVKNIQHTTLPVNSMLVKYNSQRSEAIVPYLSAPDLKGGNKNWEKAWQSGAFTVTRVQAVNYAHALQGGGEWEQLLPKTLIPRKPTQVRMGYDKNNLYMQIKCFQPQMADLYKYPASGKRDGNVWSHENVDINLTASRNSDSYYQFIIDCMGTIYDANPNRNSKDDPRGWNPDFYKHIHRDKDFWILTLALPVNKWNLPLEAGRFIDGNIARVELLNHEHSTLSPVEKAFNEADRYCRFWLGHKTELPEIVQMEMLNPMPGKNELMVTVRNSGKTTFNGVLKSGKDAVPVKLTPGKSQEFKFIVDIAKAGKATFRSELHNASGEVVDQVSAQTIVHPQLALKLNSREFIAGSSPLNADITVNDLKCDSMLEIVCGGQKKVIKAASKVKFDFTPTGDDGSVEFKVTLLNKNQPVCSVSEKISVTSDPFAE